MISRGRHQRNEVADALRRAEAAGLAVKSIHRGHCWGEVICMRCQASFAIWSTPRNPGTHAKQIDRFKQRHTHSGSQARSSTTS